MEEVVHAVWDPDRALDGVFCPKCDTRNRMNLPNEYEHILIDAELHEVETANAELSFYNEDEEGQLHVKLSRRSWDILMAAVGYIRENKEMDGDWDD